MAGVAHRRGRHVTGALLMAIGTNTYDLTMIDLSRRNKFKRVMTVSAQIAGCDVYRLFTDSADIIVTGNTTTLYLTVV